MTSEDEFRWAEALALEKQHGGDTRRWVAARIEALAHGGDDAGVERFTQIAARLDLLTDRATGRA